MVTFWVKTKRLTAQELGADRYLGRDQEGNGAEESAESVVSHGAHSISKQGILSIAITLYAYYGLAEIG